MDSTADKKATSRLTSKLTSRLKTARVQLPAKKGAGAPPVARPSAAPATGTAKTGVAKPAAGTTQPPSRVISTTSSAPSGAGLIPHFAFLAASIAWVGVEVVSYMANK